MNKKNKTLLVDIQYFPVIDWFKSLKDGLNNVIEQYETFQKMSFRNRCIISGSNGLIQLTVPLLKGREQKAFIRDIKMEEGYAWRKQHWKAIVSSYSRSPFFEHYADRVQSMIFSSHVYLFDLNLEIIETITGILKLSSTFLLTSEHKKHYEDSINDKRNFWLPKNYNSKQENWQPPYTQVFEDKFGFLPNLSILDLLFCNGGF